MVALLGPFASHFDALRVLGRQQSVVLGVVQLHLRVVLLCFVRQAMSNLQRAPQLARDQQTQPTHALSHNKKLTQGSKAWQPHLAQL